MNEKPAVILALDGSETATVALEAAEAMAKLMDATLYIVYVSEDTLSENELMERLRIQGRLALKDYSIHQIRNAEVADGILRFATTIETEMIVISSHGVTYNPEHLVGSTTMGIIERSIYPVMVIRPDMKMVPKIDWRPTKMLVPQDGTPTAASVMVQVFHIAELTKAEIDVLNIGSTQESPTEEGTIHTPRYLDYPRYDWPAWASEFVQRFYANKPAEVMLKLFERKGDPAQVMIEFSRENHDDLIALGWHGKLNRDRAHNVKELIRNSDVPIILIWCREQFTE